MNAAGGLDNPHSIAENDRIKILALLKSKNFEQVALGLTLLEALGATLADLDRVFTASALKFVTRTANEWLQDRERTRDDYRLYHSVMVRPRFLAMRSGNSGPKPSFIDLVEIQAGRFAMGEPETPRAGAGGSPVPVRLTHSFFMGRTVVTQAQWRAVMGTQPWRHTRYKNLPKNQCGDLFPAVYVSWDDATFFCSTLTDLEREAGCLSPDQTYRLPTDAEWEYVCRGGTTTAYSFGDDSRMLGHYGWFCGNSAGRLCEVARKLPNPWGFFDMHGNVWEWCADWHAAALAGGDDPAGPQEGSLRVSRGGLWGYDACHCRSAYRGACDPRHRSAMYGFRVVLAG